MNTLKDKIIFQRTILSSMFFIMLILQTVAIKSRSFWEDEAFTARIVQSDVDVIIKKIAQDVHPPLYWVVLSRWSKIFGREEWGLKSFSILGLVFVFFLLYQLAKILFNKQVALISIALFVFSPLVLTYGHNARYYSWAAVLSLLSVWSLYVYVMREQWVYLISYMISGICLTYTLYMGWVLLLALNFWWLTQWTQKQYKLKTVWLWILSNGGIFLFYYPWIQVLFRTTSNNLATDIGNTNWFKEISIRLGYLAYAFSAGEFFSPLNPILWVGLFVTGLVCIVAMVKNNNRFLLSAILLIPVIVSILFNIVAVYPQSAWQNLPNRTFFVLPFFVLFLANGIAQLRSKWRVVVITLLLLTYSVGILNYFSNRESIKPVLIVPWLDIFSDIREQSTGKTIVICSNEDTTCDYYRERFGFNQFSGTNLAQIEPRDHDIWWVQSNRGDFIGRNNVDDKVLQEIRDLYPTVHIMNYVAQDAGIAALKSRFLGTADYQYRVILYHFTSP